MNPVVINEAKKVLRREIKKRITTMSDELKLKESISIMNKLIGMEEYKLSRRISVYLSMPSEVETEGILKDIFQTKKDCFVPRYIGSNMDMVKLDSMEDFFSLPLTSWNIRQPAEDDEREEALLSGGLDLIVVPGLGFTKHGLRLGRVLQTGLEHLTSLEEALKQQWQLLRCHHPSTPRFGFQHSNL
ncbi:5-formyltetrahydrofolate cyclo-ligase-like isoform X8 [Acropora muricata]|uniref:5-formyltetrahydrofolate cyclo-ligase-like isoform X8 n=1 Tax=Acropora muricata TaxID=159855 RepID=UPI0034E52CDA